MARFPLWLLPGTDPLELGVHRQTPDIKEIQKHRRSETPVCPGVSFVLRSGRGTSRMLVRIVRRLDRALAIRTSS